MSDGYDNSTSRDKGENLLSTEKQILNCFEGFGKFQQRDGLRHECRENNSGLLIISF